MKNISPALMFYFQIELIKLIDFNYINLLFFKPAPVNCTKMLPVRMFISDHQKVKNTSIYTYNIINVIFIYIILKFI